MSVIVKGMEMPTRCEDCGFLKVMYEPPRCGWTDTKVLGNGNARLDSCPLVPVPPHGDLIDRDALKVSLAFAEKTAEWAVPALRAILMVIDEMHTIIPAEDGESW